MPPATVIFDFDSTLFDTESRKEWLWKMAAAHGYSRPEAIAIYQRARQRGGTMVLSLGSWLAALDQQRERDGRARQDDDLNALIAAMEEASALVSGARELLTWCRDQNLIRYLVSLGERSWQEEKLKQAGAGRWFEPGHILYTTDIRHGKAELLRRLGGPGFTGQRTALFNDKPDETRELLQTFPDLVAFLRHETRDQRYQAADFEKLVSEFPGRAHWSPELLELLPPFKQLVNKL